MHGSQIEIAPRRSLRFAAAGVTALTLLLAASAQAADLPMRYKAPPVVLPIYSWTGFYIGGQVGYSFGDDHLYEYLTSSGAYTNFEKKYNVSGVFGGIYGGGNYQIGSFVLGLEGDIEGGSIKGGWRDVPVGGAGDTSINIQGSLRGRLGFAVDQTLFYGTGGLAVAEVNHTYSNLVTGINETTSSVRTGWTAGAGVEMALTPNILARVEYRYTDYGMSRYDSVTSFPGLTGTQEPKLSTIRVGAAYRF